MRFCDFRTVQKFLKVNNHFPTFQIHVWDSYGYAYLQGQRFFAEKNWQADYEEDTLSATMAVAGNFEFNESIWEWELAYVYDDYYYLQGAEDVMNDSLDAWSCGGVIDYYPQL